MEKKWKRLLVGTLGCLLGWLGLPEARAEKVLFLGPGAEIHVASQGSEVEVDFAYSNLEIFQQEKNQFWIPPRRQHKLGKDDFLVVHSNVTSSEFGDHVFLGFYREDADTIRLHVLPFYSLFKGKDGTLKGVGFTAGAERIDSASPIYLKGKNLAVSVRISEDEGFQPMALTQAEGVKLLIPRYPFFPYQMRLAHSGVSVQAELGGNNTIQAGEKGFSPWAEQDYFVTVPFTPEAEAAADEAPVPFQVKIQYQEGGASKEQSFSIGGASAIRAYGKDGVAAEFRVRAESENEVTWTPLPLGEGIFSKVEWVGSGVSPNVMQTFAKPQITRVVLSGPKSSHRMVRLGGEGQGAIQQMSQLVSIGKNYDFKATGEFFQIRAKVQNKAEFAGVNEAGLAVADFAGGDKGEGGLVGKLDLAGEGSGGSSQNGADSFFKGASAANSASGCQLQPALLAQGRSIPYFWMGAATLMFLLRLRGRR